MAENERRKKRRVHTPEFKAKAGLEAVRGVKTVSEIAQIYGVHPVLVGQWKKEILEKAGALFEVKRGPEPVDENSRTSKCFITVVVVIRRLASYHQLSSCRTGSRLSRRRRLLHNPGLWKAKNRGHLML
jgi:transposase